GRSGTTEQARSPTPHSPRGTPPQHGESVMTSSALMAFLHHLAAFTVVAALAVEVALFKPPLTVLQARRLLRTDNIYGAAPGRGALGAGARASFFLQRG